VEEPRLTRRQRRQRGEEVVELRKTVIWTSPESSEDYCCVCCDGGDLLCCDGNCFRSFHISCLGMEALPEGDYLCEKCAEAPQYEGQHECDSCGIRGLTDVQCGCGRHFHSDCVGVSFGSLEFVCAPCSRGEVRVAEQPPVFVAQLMRVQPKEEEEAPPAAESESLSPGTQLPEPEIAGSEVEMHQESSPSRSKKRELEAQELEAREKQVFEASLSLSLPAAEAEEELPSLPKRQATESGDASLAPASPPDAVRASD
jgi:hypothetical protein